MPMAFRVDQPDGAEPDLVIDTNALFSVGSRSSGWNAASLGRGLEAKDDRPAAGVASDATADSGVRARQGVRPAGAAFGHTRTTLTPEDADALRGVRPTDGGARLRAGAPRPGSQGDVRYPSFASSSANHLAVIPERKRDAARNKRHPGGNLIDLLVDPGGRKAAA
jgi:hypothetical protein